MSFTREDYQQLVSIARDLVRLDAGSEVDDLAAKLFVMAEQVIGQQSPPLHNEVFPDQQP